MKAELPETISELQKISNDAQAKFGSLSNNELNWKPNAEIWSVGQCFEHLIITNELYFPAIQKVVDGKHRNNFYSKIPFSTNIIAALMKNSLKPEQPRKMKTFKIFEPTESEISSSIFNDFAESNRKLAAMIAASENLEVHKIKIPEPLHPALNLRLDNAFEILVLHEKRHFLQAERILQAKNFSVNIS